MSNNLSQEEINQLLLELEQYHKETDKQLAFDFNKVDNIKDHIEIETCLTHLWEKYEGIRESFFHCKVCGEKQ